MSEQFKIYAEFIKDASSETQDLETYLLFMQFCIQFEKIFSLFQCVKILHYMGLQYDNLYKSNALSVGLRNLLYKEKTTKHFLTIYLLLKKRGFGL